MAATLTEVKQIGANMAARYTWSGTAPFWVMARGQFVLQNSEETEWITQHEDGATHVEPVPLEVVDSTGNLATMQQLLHPPGVTLQFRGQRTNLYYRAQYWNGATWVNSVAISEDGRGYYQIRTGPLGTRDYLFRVVPYDASGTAGEPLVFSIFHHTTPEPREFTYTYDSGTGDVTVDDV